MEKIIIHKVELQDIKKIKPYKNNAKAHSPSQIQKVADSIKTNGFTQPILVDKKGVIVVGHCRYEASKMLNLEKVPVSYLNDLTEKQIAEYRLIDNKTNESPWVIENIRLEGEFVGLDKLKDMGFGAEIEPVSIPHDFEDGLDGEIGKEISSVRFEMKPVGVATVRFGRYNFTVPIDEYDKWVQGRVKDGNSSNKEIILWIKNQLKLS